jgi:hypothetical protein
MASGPAPLRRPRWVAALAFLCACALATAPVDGQDLASKVFKLSSRIAPKSLAYDTLHDKYFTHKGKLSDKNGFLSALSPTGEVIKEDFGMCDEENRGLEVRLFPVQSNTLKTLGLDFILKIRSCVFQETTFTRLRS